MPEISVRYTFDQQHGAPFAFPVFSLIYGMYESFIECALAGFKLSFNDFPLNRSTAGEG